jgi:hypothetical protein
MLSVVTPRQLSFFCVVNSTPVDGGVEGPPYGELPQCTPKGIFLSTAAIIFLLGLQL